MYGVWCLKSALCTICVPISLCPCGSPIPAQSQLHRNFQLANPSLSWRHWAAQLPRGRQDPRSGLRSALMYRGNKKKNGTRPPVRFNGKSGKSPKCSRASLLSHDLSQTTRLVTATSSCRARASSSCATSSIVRSACSRRSSSPSNQTLMGSLALRPVGAHSIWTECH